MTSHSHELVPSASQSPCCHGMLLVDSLRCAFRSSGCILGCWGMRKESSGAHADGIARSESSDTVCLASWSWLKGRLLL